MSLIHYQPGGGIQIVGSSKGGAGGPPGPPGPSGLQGPTGPQGPQGFTTGAVYFLNYDTSASVGGYYDMSKIPKATVSPQVSVSAGTTDATPVLSFVTPVGDPNQAIILAGVWTFHQHVIDVQLVGAPTPLPELYAKVYKRDTFGVETLLYSNSSSPITLNAVAYNQWYDYIVTFPSDTVIVPTDRIVVKLYVKSYGYSLKLEYGGNLAAQVITTLSAFTQGFTGPTGPTGPIGGSGFTGATGPAAGTDVYISAYSNTTQIITDGGIAPVDITHHATSIALNASLSGGNIQVNLAGVYKIMFSVQFIGNSGNGKLVIFVRKNGNPIADTATRTAFKKIDEAVITVEVIDRFAANDIISIACYATAASLDIFYAPATTVAGIPVPACPGIITDIFKIAN